MTEFPKVEDVHNRVSWANSKQLQLTIEPSLPSFVHFTRLTSSSTTPHRKSLFKLDQSIPYTITLFPVPKLLSSLRLSAYCLSLFFKHLFLRHKDQGTYTTNETVIDYAFIKHFWDSNQVITAMCNTKLTNIKDANRTPHKPVMISSERACVLPLCGIYLMYENALCSSS